MDTVMMRNADCDAQTNVTGTYPDLQAHGCLPGAAICTLLCCALVTSRSLVVCQHHTTLGKETVLPYYMVQAHIYDVSPT